MPTTASRDHDEGGNGKAADRNAWRSSLGSRWAPLAGYLGLIIGAIALFLLIRGFGEQLTAPADHGRAVGRPAVGQVDVVFHVLATLAAVVFAGFVMGRVFAFLGQPPVIGEVVAGIMLGPSLLGAVWPDAMYFLIPSATDDPNGHVPAALRAISQLGVVLYMFLVGLELNASRLAGRAHAAVAVSHTGIVVPFVLGAALALALYPRFSYEGVAFTHFALFMGVAMAITAFPVLARILTDRKLDKTPLGEVALGCAAADDVTAWCLLAFVMGVAQASVGSVVGVIGGTLAFIAVMFLVVGPMLNRAVAHEEQRSGDLSRLAVSGTFFAVLLAALTTEAIGIHAVFGAFLLGVVIPHDSRISSGFAAKTRDLVMVLLLPAFFAFTGMRTQIGLVSSWEHWLWCGAIILVATAGKFGGTVVAARLTKLDWRESAALGILMNTRGLMELIVLNIGLDLGLITPTLYAMMVIMALVTTAATAPVLQWLAPATNAEHAPQGPVDI